MKRILNPLLPSSLLGNCESPCSLFKDAFRDRVFGNQIQVDRESREVSSNIHQLPSSAFVVPKQPWIIIEGMDGSGKSTIVSRVGDQLGKVAPTAVCPMPGTTTLGVELRRLILDLELSLNPKLAVKLMSINAHDVLNRIIVPMWAYDMPRFVITDRWPTISGFVYQGDNFKPGFDTDLDTNEELTEAYGVLMAPLIFYISVSAEASLRRRPPNPSNPFEATVHARREQFERYEEVINLMPQSCVRRLYNETDDHDNLDNIVASITDDCLSYMRSCFPGSR